MNVNIGGVGVGGLDSLMTPPAPWRPFTITGLAFSQWRSDDDAVIVITWNMWNMMVVIII